MSLPWLLDAVSDSRFLDASARFWLYPRTLPITQRNPATVLPERRVQSQLTGAQGRDRVASKEEATAVLQRPEAGQVSGLSGIRMIADALPNCVACAAPVSIQCVAWSGYNPWQWERGVQDGIADTLGQVEWPSKGLRGRPCRCVVCLLRLCDPWGTAAQARADVYVSCLGGCDHVGSGANSIRNAYGGGGTDRDTCCDRHAGPDPHARSDRDTCPD